MMYDKSVSVAAVVAGLALLAPPPASAVVCGQPDPLAEPPNAESAKATLTLDAKSSKTNLLFKREKGHRTISLFFTTAGCDLPRNLPDPRLVVLPEQGSWELPDGVMKVKSAEVDGAEFLLRIDVDAGKFKPGTYDGLLVARSKYLNSNRTPISVSRSEHRIWIPLLIGAITGLAGMIWFALLRGASQAQLAVGRQWLVVLSGVCMVAGMVAVFISYWDQNVWTLEENLIAGAIAGFTGATTGAMAGVLGVIWATPAQNATRTVREDGNGQAKPSRSRARADSAKADR